MLKKIDDIVKKYNGARIGSYNNEYELQDTKFKFKCKNDHEFEKTAKKLLASKSSWCHTCVVGKRTIEDMIKIAKVNDGECLSTEFINTKTKLKWKCFNGHEFERTHKEFIVLKHFFWNVSLLF
jgi:hypothetical protein